MLGALVDYRINNHFVTEHTEGMNLCRKYLLKTKTKQSICVIVKKLQILLIVMAIIIKFNIMKKLNYLSIAIFCVGALFKHNSFPYANILVSIGLLFMAITFLIMAFYKN